MKIIIVSYDDDSHKDQVLRTAAKIGLDTILFDAGGYPFHDTEIGIEYGREIQSVLLKIDGKIIEQKEIVGIWWRRPRGAKAKSKSAMDQYMHQEGESVIRSLEDILPDTINWISKPEATRIANRKPVQLMVANKIGLTIPASCISNSPEQVLNFLDRMKGKKLIMKPVGTSFVELSKDDSAGILRNKVIFTQIIEHDLIRAHSDMIRNCPVIFQEAVEKDYDIRITVVDHQVFCAEVILEGCSNPANVDWRNYDGKRVYRRHELPREIEEKCIQFTRAMGLRFGCIDMAYSQSKGYTFFEINPQGQWLPSETELNYPISTALLEALTRAK